VTPAEVLAARERLGWTRAELARRAGVHSNVVRRYERGERVHLGYCVVEAIEKAVTGKTTWRPIRFAPKTGAHWLLFSYNGGPAWAGEWKNGRWWGPLPYPTSFLEIPGGAF